MRRSTFLILFFSTLFLLLFESHTINAQTNIDSLKNSVIEVKNDRNKAELYFKIADYYYTENIDSSISYAKHYLEFSEKAKDTAWIADAHNFIAYAYDQKGEVELALEHFEKALDKFLILEDSFFIASTYTNIGYMTSYGMDQAKGLNYFMEAMQIAEDVKDPGLLSDISSNIAYYYYRVNDYKTSLKYYKNSLEYSKKGGDSLYIAVGYADVASINVKMKDFKAASENMLKSKQVIPKKPQDYDFANYCLSLSGIYIDWNHTDSAQSYLDKAEYLINKNNFKVLEAYLYQNKGNLAFLKKRYKESIAYLDTSIIHFTNINTIEPFLDIYSKKADAYSKLNLFKKAFTTLQEANILYESLGYGVLGNMLGEFEQKRINRIRNKNIELENKLIQQKDENFKINMKAKMRNAVISILFLICILAIVFYFLWKIRKKNNDLITHNDLIEDQKTLVEQNVKQLELSEKNFKELNATKDKFFSIIGHDLKNPFSSLSGFTEILLTDKELRESDKIIPILESMNESAGYGFNLLSDLLEWARSQTGNIIPKPEKLSLNDTVEKVVSDFKSIASKKYIKFDLQISSPFEVLADENMLKTVLRNLIHNAVKFSYENGTVKINSFVKEGFVVTSIEDEGVGLSEKELSTIFAIDNHIQKPGTKNEKGSGLGLVLCKEFVIKNNGKIWVDGQEKEGCKFSFSLPIYNKEIDSLN